MYIELTDHLRCPADHEERFLVLLPDQVEGRSVRLGQLGCPLCGRVFDLVDGALNFGDGELSTEAETRLDADSLTPLAGVEGPGGYLVLVGAPAAGWQELAERLPGVGLVAVNPPPGVPDQARLSVLRAPNLPLKTHSMRGVVLGAPYGSDLHWVREAARVVLPGLRVVAEGSDPPSEVIDLMASAGGVWVGTARR